MKESQAGICDAHGTTGTSSSTYGHKASRGAGHWFRKSVGGVVREITSVKLTEEETTKKANDMMEIQRLQNELGMEQKKKKLPHQKYFYMAKKVFGPPSEKASIKLERLQHTHRVRAQRTPEGSISSFDDKGDDVSVATIGNENGDQNEVNHNNQSNCIRRQDEMDHLHLPNLANVTCAPTLMPSSIVAKAGFGTNQSQMVNVVLEPTPDIVCIQVTGNQEEIYRGGEGRAKSPKMQHHVGESLSPKSVMCNEIFFL